MKYQYAVQTGYHHHHNVGKTEKFKNQPKISTKKVTTCVMSWHVPHS